MKKITVFICFVLSIIVAPAQNKTRDSLKMSRASPTKPLQRFHFLNRRFEDALIDGDRNIDSASCIEMMKIAQETNNDSLLATSYNIVASFFFLDKGDNTNGLEYLFKALPLAQKVKDKRRISSLYFDMAYVYTRLQNVQEAIKYNRKGAESLPDPSSPMYDFMLRQYQDNMTNCFLLLRQPDSALHWAQALNETNRRFKSRNYDAIALRDLATVYEQLGDTALAGVYYKRAIALVDSMPHYNNKLFTKASYSNFLLLNNRVPEAKKQAMQLFQLGEQISNNDIKLEGTGLLRRVFDKLGQIDSAYYYSRMEATINASIFSQDNEDKIQALAFNEKIRQMEEADELADEAREHNQKIQYALLALGIVAFLLLYLILSHSLISDAKLIGFLGVIALLLVFEFLNLLMHPFLERVTHHSPVLMLFALVCIAALLVPMHHRLEKWVTAKLIEKNRKIRLSAAKKTLQDINVNTGGTLSE